MTKKELRSYIRSLKKKFSADQLAEKSREVCRILLTKEQYRKSKTMLLYKALPDEVDTDIIIADAAASGKKVLLPVVIGDDLELRLYTGPDSLKVGAFDILEPVGDVFTDYDAIDMAVIPGMAFDGNCHRLGRGKGYYDRLLPRLKNALKIGICFDFQYLEDIPSELHDVRVDEVCC